jgi:outer membrane protein assembly factor BamE (lipoprotein component of BamABCDE complex)
MILRTMILAQSVLLCACVSSGTQVKQTSLDQFHEGTTTEADVTKALGPPQGRNVSSDGTHQLVYVYMHAHAKGASYIPVVGLFAGGAKGNSTAVRFDFDSSGKLTHYAANQTATDVNTGIGSAK